MANVLISSDVDSVIAAADQAGIRTAMGLGDLPFYSTVAAMLASTEASLGVGVIWEAEGHKYREAASAATDYHVITAGGVKLYAVPDAEGWITTDQLGWADDFECRDELFRIVPALPQYSKLLICHKLLFTPTTVQVTLPIGFTLAAKRKKRDGFHFPAGAPNLFRVFWIYSHTTIEGLSFTSEIFTIDRIFGTILFATTTTPNQTGIVVKDCVFNVPCNTPVYLQGIEDSQIVGCDFLDGQRGLLISSGGDRWVVDSCNFKSGTFNNSEQIKTHYGTGPSRFCRISNCEFFESYRDGIDTTGSIQDSIIENCRFIRCGVGFDGTGVGFGGIDFKVTQGDSENPREPTARVHIVNCLFEDSVCRSTSNFDYDPIQAPDAGWDDATPAERDRWGIHDIWFRNNVFLKTGNNSLPCDTRVERSTMDGDAFLGGAKFLEIPRVAKNIIWENSVTPVYQGQSGRSIHFAKFFDPPGATGAFYFLMDNCSDITISGNFFGGTLGSIFGVRNSGGGSDHVKFIDCNVVTQGGMTFVSCGLLANQPANGMIVLENCRFENLREAINIQRDTTDYLIVRGCDWIDGVDALVKYGGLSNTPAINNVVLMDNWSNGGTLETGTQTEIVAKTVSGNVGFA